MNGLVARESYIYCDYCMMQWFRWLAANELLDGNPLAVRFGLNHQRIAKNHSPVCWHLFIAESAFEPSEYRRVEWPKHGEYSYESITGASTPESNGFLKDALDNL